MGSIPIPRSNYNLDDAARKVVYPKKMTVPGGARMEWMWWGVSCSQGKDGSLSQTIFEDANQILAHGDGLTRIGAGEVASHTIAVGTAAVGVTP